MQKKLVYLYLGHYAHTHEGVLLVINTLQKDCRDQNPVVRGLALRAFASLQVKNLVEHALNAVKNGLLDVSAYVRKCAALACAKLFSSTSSSLVSKSRTLRKERNTLVNRLYEMLRDGYAEVVLSAANALDFILRHEGGIKLNRSITAHLFSNLRFFSDWGKCAVLRIVLRSNAKKAYKETEVVNVMNTLDPYLKHPNPALVMAVVNVFLKLTEDTPKIHSQVYFRIKGTRQELVR